MDLKLQTYVKLLNFTKQGRQALLWESAFLFSVKQKNPQLYEESKDLLLSKGLFIRSPNLPNLEQVEYVKKQWFILDVFGEKRPLVAAEVDNLFANLQRNAFGVATLTGFS
ncbi:hypothetical protein [Neobacillus cucumis]|uniref:hypothetical protein n=1 Tax=Neobacillus cucumis TaxID=1740721 RepID=UPI002852F4E9|nr:hypothetical protein [Neobacillus cucumis]MDR4950333.1 hypothetical protein [Neobacillus cucumis]